MSSPRSTGCGPQAQRAALRVRDRRERLDQLLELLGGLDHLPQVHGVVARDAAHALDRAREAIGRRQRRPEVVTGVDDEVRKIAGFSAHAGARVMDARPRGRLGLEAEAARGLQAERPLVPRVAPQGLVDLLAPITAVDHRRGNGHDPGEPIGIESAVCEPVGVVAPVGRQQPPELEQRDELVEAARTQADLASRPSTATPASG